MLTPPTLFRVDASGSAAPIQALPAQFDASGMVVEQQFATSPDGTRIPYFLVHRKDVKGPVPVLMHAYGGFELAQTPSYLVHEPYRSGPLALFWVQQGNAYVLANIRGGGEYGPALAQIGAPRETAESLSTISMRSVRTWSPAASRRRGASRSRAAPTAA